jgi:RNA polymerase sigma factor (sigma-70 family)
VTVQPFEQIVAEHGEIVLRVCRAVVGPHDAEDAWSETFLAALRAYPRLRPDSNVRAWLVTIAHRKAIDRYRSAMRGPVVVADVPERPVDGSWQPSDSTLWDAVRNLPPKQRAAVAYHYVADLPYVDVGRLIGTTEAAARRNAADGIAALRRTDPSLTTPKDRP